LHITLVKAIEIIELNREEIAKKTIKIFGENEEIKILDGRWGPYISYQKNNYKIPKTTDPLTLTMSDCLKLIKESPAKSNKRQPVKKENTKAKKAPAKRAPAKNTKKKKK
jgi:DNA topoisomerase-1